MEQGDIVRFTKPQNDYEKTARFVVLENRDPRLLVVDIAYLDDANWKLKPSNVYVLSDMTCLTNGRCEFCQAPLFNDKCTRDGDFTDEELEQLYSKPSNLLGLWVE